MPPGSSSSLRPVAASGALRRSTGTGMNARYRRVWSSCRPEQHMSGVSAWLSPKSDSMILASCSQHHTLQPQTPSANEVHCTLPAFNVAELWLCLQC